MDVLIIETKTGKPAATIALAMLGQDYKPYECFRRAWKVAAAGKSVDPTRRDEYSFRMARPA